MAKRVQVKMRSAGANAILTSSGVTAEVHGRGNAVLARAGDGYKVANSVNTAERDGTQRATSRVYTASYKAMKDNARNNTLLKAMGGG